MQKSNSITCDFLVIGAGVIGLAIANEIKKRHPDSSIIVIEKEFEVGAHASGRNSGVLHAGFYYHADSLKARFTKNGNYELHAYCDQYKLPINRCGKLVVAKDESDQDSLDLLFERGAVNGINIEEVDEETARELEPRVKTHQRALWSPTTSSIDPKALLSQFLREGIQSGITYHFNTRFLRCDGNAVYTTHGWYEAGYVINAAGLYADKVAHCFGFGGKYRILPFKGIYLYSSEPAKSLTRHIYPVPNLDNPFLGVHFTIAVDGKIKIGPTAIPAFWREQYGGFSRFKPNELFDILARQLQLFFSADFDFRGLAKQEMKKYNRQYLAEQASRLAHGVIPEHYRQWGKPGIRAQLIAVKERRLEMDFVLEGDDKSMHVLNAVSPGLTCSIPFARHVCDEISHRTD